MRITRAYCVELDDVITIDAARREYLSCDPRPRRFRFLCSSPACRAAEVKVTAVNYMFNSEEGTKQVAAHFRENPAHTHLQGCEWVSLMHTEQAQVRHPHETDEQTVQRWLRRKLTDLVTGFDPRLADDRAITTGEGNGVGGRIRANSVPGAQRPDVDRQGDVRTRDLHRLVETFVETRERLPSEQRNELMLNVTGVGTLKLVDYFRPLQFCDPYTRDRVIFGGATLEGRYGVGFKLRFYDRINELRVYLYVSPQQIDDYRFGRYMRGIIDDGALRKYFTVYALGRLEIGPKGRSMNLVVEDLRHLVIMLGPLK